MAAPISIMNFQGEIPRVHPRLLPPGFAKSAVNTRLTSGRLDGFRRARLTHTFGEDVQTIFRDGDDWYGFPGEAHVVRGPVAQDRLYFTAVGETPKMRIAGTDYELALPAPAAAPMLTALSAADPALLNDVVFAYTFVTEFDEESAPSPVSDPVAWSPGVVVRVEGFSAPVANRGVDRIRIYRSQTSALGVTDLYFVAEFPVATSEYDHDLEAEPIQEVIPSTDYDTPPATMRGLTAMHNGMMSAFSGRDLYFCEPYRPHAWPIRYRLTTDYPIVGLAAFGSTLAILTTGTPYIAQGSAPENMTMERMDSNMPCVSSRGIVDFGYAAAYPSNDGLALITPSGVQLASRNLFSQQDWRALLPKEMVAANYDGRYAFTYGAEALPEIDSGTADEPSDDVLDGGGAVLNGTGAVVYECGAATIQTAFTALGFIDLTGEQPFFIETDASVHVGPVSLYHDEQSGNLFMLNEDKRRVFMFDGAAMPVAPFFWESGELHLSGLQNFGAILIESDEKSLALGDLTVTVKAGAREFALTPTLNVPQRLPGGFLERKWQICVKGVVPVTNISMAVAISDFAT